MESKVEYENSNFSEYFLSVELNSNINLENLGVKNFVEATAQLFCGADFTLEALIQLDIHSTLRLSKWSALEMVPLGVGTAYLSPVRSYKWEPSASAKSLNR